MIYVSVHVTTVKMMHLNCCFILTPPIKTSSQKTFKHYFNTSVLYSKQHEEDKYM